MPDAVSSSPSPPPRTAGARCGALASRLPLGVDPAHEACVAHASCVCPGRVPHPPPPLPPRHAAGVTVKKTPATLGAKKLSEFKAKSKVTQVKVGRSKKATAL